MQRKNRILSLIDFSEYSEKILRHTKSLSAYLQADVLLIHQLPGIVTARASADVREQVYKAEREDANERLAELAGPVFDTMPPMIASQQDLKETLYNLRNDLYFDWLFVCLKGKSLLEQLFLSSKAVEVLDETCFVTVAFPLEKEIFFLEELVVAVHTEYAFDSTRLKTVLAQLSGGVRKITFLTVINDEEQRVNVEATQSRLASEFADLMPSTIIFEGSDVLKVIEGFMQEKEKSFLVVQQSDSLLHDTIFKRGLINELVYKSTVPMIILPYTPTDQSGGASAT